jgi:ATP-dependent DNA helicase RecG
VTDEELATLVADLESEQVERKESLTNKARICEAICAFANDLPNSRQPGYMIIGATDDGRPAGLDVTDELLLELADLRSNGQLYPFPVLSVEKRSLDGLDIAVVTVQPSDFPPVRYNGRVWIRVGPSRRRATPEEERRLVEKRRAGDLPFDARPLPSATQDDLDLDVFRSEYLPAAIAKDVLQANQRTIEDQLTSLRFASPEGVPTAAGLLVLGNEPTAILPGTYVQFLRIDGTELDGPIKDQKRLDGPLSQLLRSLDELLRLNIATSLDYMNADTEVATPDYPVAALQQFVRNAVMHRNYDGTNAPVRLTWFNDRVEVQSPGGPYGQVTVENFGSPGVTDYRNPTLAEAMRALGFVQRFGVGIQSAKRALSDNGNPPPELEPHPENVLVTIRSRP